MENSQQQGVLVRKYPNRKYYLVNARALAQTNSEQVRQLGNSAGYVNLTDIKALVKAGLDVKVLDYRSERDITTEVMASIYLKAKKDEFLALTMSDIQQHIRDS